MGRLRRRGREGLNTTTRSTIAGVAADVRFGSLADILVFSCDVRFAPNSGHVQCNSVCPLWAKSGHGYDIISFRTPLLNSGARSLPLILWPARCALIADRTAFLSQRDLQFLGERACVARLVLANLQSSQNDRQDQKTSSCSSKKTWSLAWLRLLLLLGGVPMWKADHQGITPSPCPMTSMIGLPDPAV
jgi:hypothetical protein